MLEEYEEEPTLGRKIIKIISGFFLTILVSMLILTLLPGDAEQNMFKMITGQDNYSAGKVGDETINPDYFQAARRDCYQRYKDYNPNLANDASELNSCAYDLIKSFKVYRVLSESVGYGVSENRIKELLWEQAKQAHKESYIGAGYSEDDKLKPEDIYRNILRSTPMQYRLDYMVSMTLDRFLISDLPRSASEKILEAEASAAKISFTYLQFSDSDLLSKIADIPVTEEEVRAEYDKSIKENTLQKNPEGKLPTYEERKVLLENKLKVEKRQAQLTEIKAKLLTLKNQNSKIQELAQITGLGTEDIKDMPLSSLSKPGETRNLGFTRSNAFLKDIGEISFGSGKLSGPYSNGENTAYVEFKELKIQNEPKSDEKNDRIISNLSMFLMEVNTSLKTIYPVYRKLDKQEN